VTEARAAGGPAARLVAQAVTEATALDEHRRQLAADNPELADLLLGFEEDAFRQLQGRVRAGLDAAEAAARATPPPHVPGIRDRLRHGLGRVASRHKQQPRRRRREETRQVVEGFVVPDEPGNGAGARSADPEDDKEPS
jgi:hypothetical protein